MTAHGGNPWIWRPEPRPAAAVRLFCVPYAGGGASVYRRWGQLLPAAVEVCAVQLPGRESRISEPPLTAVEPLVAAATDALRPELDRPFAIFGHSMGALLAYEIARALRQAAGPEPGRLFLSARPAPHCPLRPVTTEMVTLPDDAFADRLRALGGLPVDLTEDSELVELLLPTVRADFAVCASYRHAEEPPLACAISAFASPDDPQATPEEAEAWRRHTTGAFRFRRMSGGHLYVNTSTAALIDAVTEDLRLRTPA